MNLQKYTKKAESQADLLKKAFNATQNCRHFHFYYKNIVKTNNLSYLCEDFSKAGILYLIIDIGNNSTKYFLFGKESIILHGRRAGGNFDFVHEYARQFDIDGIIVSSVITLDNDTKEYIDKACRCVIWFDNNTPMPIKIDYRTPDTLGSDRLAAAIGAMQQAPGRNILVIDAGSAITIDLIDSKGHFLGGNISPGVKMRLTALHSQTSRLPQIEKEGDIPKFGYNTETAIRSGVIRGICHEIDGYIAEIKGVFPDVLVFLTGGDEKTLIDKIKSPIFADKFLVAKGLKHILTKNIC